MLPDLLYSLLYTPSWCLDQSAFIIKHLLQVVYSTISFCAPIPQGLAKVKLPRNTMVSCQFYFFYQIRVLRLQIL